MSAPLVAVDVPWLLYRSHFGLPSSIRGASLLPVNFQALPSRFSMTTLRNRPPTQLVGVQSSLQRLLQALLALSGLSAENMERDSAWLFLDAGRRAARHRQHRARPDRLVLAARGGLLPGG